MKMRGGAPPEERCVSETSHERATWTDEHRFKGEGDEHGNPYLQASCRHPMKRGIFKMRGKVLKST